MQRRRDSGILAEVSAPDLRQKCEQLELELHIEKLAHEMSVALLSSQIRQDEDEDEDEDEDGGYCGIGDLAFVFVEDGIGMTPEQFSDLMTEIELDTECEDAIDKAA